MPRRVAEFRAIEFVVPSRETFGSDGTDGATNTAPGDASSATGVTGALESTGDVRSCEPSQAAIAKVTRAANVTTMERIRLNLLAATQVSLRLNISASDD